MKKTFKNFRFKLLAVAFLLIAFSCDKDNENEPLTTQELFNAPSIESAQQFFNQNSSYPNISGTQARNSSSSLLTDWQSSKTKDYKKTPEADVDILYTPIYLQTNRNAKAFIASTQQGDNIESKIVLTLYKNTNDQNGLSAYIFIYNTDGTLELEYNIENGQPIPFATNTTNDGVANRTMTTDCSDLPGLTLGEFLIWLSNCTIALDEVVIIGQLGGGGSGDDSFNADLPNFMQIPYIGDIAGDIGAGDIGGGSSSGTVNGAVYASNVIAPTSFSISAALGIPFSDVEAQWLLEQSINNQSLLSAIAEFLNLSKKRPANPVFGIVNPNQLPDVSEEAINFVLYFINFLNDNPQLNSGGGISQQEFNDLENCYESNVDSNFDECFEELYLEQFIHGMEKDCQALAIFYSISKTKNDSDFTLKIWNHFFKTSSTNHINIQDEPLPGNAGALVGIELESNEYYDDVVIMQFDNTYLDTATTLGFVNTFYHELVHAYIVNLYHNGTLLTEYPNYTDLKTSMDNLLTDTDNTTFKEAYKQESHNIYTDFIDDLAEAIVAYCSYANISGVDLAYAKKLVWGGLKGNNVFTENLTITERLEAQTLLAYENSNTGAKKGTKTCN